MNRLKMNDEQRNCWLRMRWQAFDRGMAHRLRGPGPRLGLLLSRGCVILGCVMLGCVGTWGCGFTQDASVDMPDAKMKRFSEGREVSQAPDALQTLVSQVGLDQRLNEQLPLQLNFLDHQGRRITLSQYFSKRPVVLVFAYARCPLLCNQVLAGLLRAVNSLDLDLGRDYEVVVISIDPRETAQDAELRQVALTSRLRDPERAKGWHFLTGSEPEIKTITQAAGFRYTYDEASGQYAHASGLLVLTPQGRVSRLMYGIDFPTRDLRWSLMESSQERIGSPVDQVLLLCFHYDPTTGRYGLVISRVLRAAGLLTMVVLGTYLTQMARKEWQRTRVELGTPVPGGPTHER